MSICLLFKGISFRGMKRHNRNKKEYACIIILSIYVPSGKKFEKSSAITEDRTVVIEGGGVVMAGPSSGNEGRGIPMSKCNPYRPQSGGISPSGRSPEKWQFYHIFPHFSKREPSKSKKYRVQYIKLKTTKCCFKYKRNDSVLIKWWS